MSLAARFEKMSAREQRLLVVLAALGLGMLVIGVPFYLYTSVTSARDTNADIRAQLGKMDRAAELLGERRAAREAREQLYSAPQAALATLVENAARAQEIDVPESSDQPDVTTKGFIEHSTQVRFRKVGLRALVSTLEQIERSGIPIAITSLHITARSQPDEYDVTLTVSQFEKKRGGGEGKKSGAAAEPTSKGQAL